MVSNTMHRPPQANLQISLTAAASLKLQGTCQVLPASSPSFAKSNGVEIEELERLRQRKLVARGGFRERILLKSVDECTSLK